MKLKFTLKLVDVFFILINFVLMYILINGVINHGHIGFFITMSFLQLFNILFFTNINRS